MIFQELTPTQMIMIYITCANTKEAEKIGEHLLKAKLAGCINIYPEISPMFPWPPKSGIIDRSKEIVLIVKSVWKHYKEIEAEIIKIHSFDTPCIIALPVAAVSDKYWEWIKDEIKD